MYAHDNAIAVYRIKIKSKKWYWPLFVNGMSQAMINAWKLFRRVNNSSIGYLEFLSEVTICLVKYEEKKIDTEFAQESVEKEENNIKKGIRHKHLPEDIRFDNLCHWIVESPTRNNVFFV